MEAYRSYRDEVSPLLSPQAVEVTVPAPRDLASRRTTSSRCSDGIQETRRCGCECRRKGGRFGEDYLKCDQTGPLERRFFRHVMAVASAVDRFGPALERLARAYRADHTASQRIVR
jgi:hypothetical protein